METFHVASEHRLFFLDVWYTHLPNGPGIFDHKNSQPCFWGQLTDSDVTTIWWRQNKTTKLDINLYNKIAAPNIAAP